MGGAWPGGAAGCPLVPGAGYMYALTIFGSEEKMTAIKIPSSFLSSVHRCSMSFNEKFQKINSMT